MECAVDDSAGRIASPSSSGEGDIFGDPQVSPRVGYQYQAEIPSFVHVNERKQLIKIQDGAHVEVEASHPFLYGLPIPITWIRDEVESINGTVDFQKSEDSHITSSHECDTLAVEALGDGKEFGVGVDKMDIDSVTSWEPKPKLNQTDTCCRPLPGSLGESLTHIERDSFVLGLYIFGKNLMLVKRFVQGKHMGDMLSFYYGKFYRSAEYRRWSECRKMRIRRRIHGEKLFTGWRQQELLSRLGSCVSEETQNMLCEVSRKFGDGKVSLEEYVFGLKDMVGNPALIEAMSIGRGKKDLTGMAMDPVKSSPVFPSRPEIPTGKACSSLTPTDIVKFLTGDFRLSKARSNDLFWEAVWPRLLVRGWHSEQPMDHGVSSLKHSLVFLTPGVKKFSRRKLVKGNHYFDSVSDVLNIVASEPELLELDTEAEKGGEVKEDHEFDDNSSKQQRHCYLQPRKSSLNENAVKLTIIDTSLVDGKGRSKVRELRSLPVDVSNVSTSSSLSSEQDTSEDSEAASKCVDNVTTIPNGSSLVNGKHRVHQKRKLSSGRKKFPGPARKRQNFISCSQGESSRSRFDEGSENQLHSKLSPEKPETRVLIDLNIPQMSRHSGTGKPFIANEHEGGMSRRRQSRRNRPLTTKALEALEWGFLSRKKKGKACEGHESYARTSQRTVTIHTPCDESEDNLSV